MYSADVCFIILRICWLISQTVLSMSSPFTLKTFFFFLTNNKENCDSDHRGSSLVERVLDQLARIQSRCFNKCVMSITINYSKSVICVIYLLLFFSFSFFSPGGVAKLGEIPHASTRSLILVVAGTVCKEGSQLILCLSCWLSWGFRVRSITSRSQQLWFNPTFPNEWCPYQIMSWGLVTNGHPIPFLIIKKKKK